MPVVRLSDGEQISFTGNKATIGSNSNCTIVIRDDPRIANRHAVIKNIAGRWLVESTSETLLSANDSEPNRLCWIKSNDQIKLTQDGPEIVFFAEEISTDDDSLKQTETLPPPAAAQQTASDSIPDYDAVVEPQEVMPREDSSLLVSTEPTTSSTVPVGLPHSAGPITINVSGNQSGTNSPLLWVGGGLIFLILILIIILFFIFGLSRSQQLQGPYNAQAVQPNKNNDQQVNQTSGLDNQVTENNKSIPALPVRTSEFDVRKSIYTVFAQENKSQLFLRIGTAFAISNNQLITSGSVGAFIERNKEQYPIIQVHSTTNTDAIFLVRKTSLLPDYRQFVNTSYDLDREIRKLQEGMNNRGTPPSKQELNQASQKMESLNDHMFQTVEQLICLDVAMLQVQGELPVHLELADELPTPNRELTIWGVPFLQEDAEFIAGESKYTAKSMKGYFIRFQGLENNSLKRLLVKCKGDDMAYNWNGSPLLNSRNKVVGLYSRPTPDKDFNKPPSGEQCDVPTLEQIRKLTQL
ncbi:FHA domain-containing protein [Gimesia algae]|uniref:FHA domain-containing protein n=1 Tax=Gimesia algae TaxID=2527971 RepID=A0A517VHR7_9PLAN|nr:FHA domain-containing protein [Gimesia algae]QDT92512.1 hypothetical protein Pan161_41800 [Gimesia algae]